MPAPQAAAARTVLEQKLETMSKAIAEKQEAAELRLDHWCQRQEASLQAVQQRSDGAQAGALASQALEIRQAATEQKMDAWFQKHEGMMAAQQQSITQMSDRITQGMVSNGEAIGTLVQSVRTLSVDLESLGSQQAKITAQVGSNASEMQNALDALAKRLDTAESHMAKAQRR